jgi:hypothetical protein
MDQIAPLPPDLAPSRAGSAVFVAECASVASALPCPLHGNSAPRRAAAKLRADLTAHCNGRPSATQAAIIAQAAEIKLRLAVMDQDFIRTGRRSAHATRDYLAWANSFTRLLRQLGLKGTAECAPTLADYLAAKATKPPASATPTPPASVAAPPPAPAQRAALAADAGDCAVPPDAGSSGT